MKIVLTVWMVIIILCILEAYFCTKFEDECIFVGRPKDLLTKYGSQEDDSYYKQNTNDDG